MGTVLVAVDETEASERVAAFVNGFFAGGRAKVVGINVATVRPAIVPSAIGWGGMYPWGYPYADPLWPAPADADAGASHAAAERTVVGSGLEDAETVSAFGDPVEAILEAAERQGADLIVVGSHHRGILRRLFEGSVSEQVVKQADRPVLVVP